MSLLKNCLSPAKTFSPIETLKTTEDSIIRVRAYLNHPGSLSDHSDWVLGVNSRRKVFAVGLDWRYKRWNVHLCVWRFDQICRESVTLGTCLFRNRLCADNRLQCNKGAGWHGACWNHNLFRKILILLLIIIKVLLSPRLQQQMAITACTLRSLKKIMKVLVIRSRFLTLTLIVI